MSEYKTIGFIGLGVMGEPICRNLVKKSGARVRAFDLSPEPLARLSADGAEIAASVERMATDVQAYVQGYRVKQKLQFDRIEAERPIRIPGVGARMHGLKTSIFLEVEGAAHYLPAYAGNLDIMTSAALRTAESMAERMLSAVAA